MANSDELRERATRLLALALQARETGQSEYADELTKLAADILDEANAADPKKAIGTGLEGTNVRYRTLSLIIDSGSVPGVGG